MNKTVLLFCLAFGTAGAAQIGEPFLDFRDVPARVEKPYASWRWDAETRARAEDFTSQAVEPAPDGGGNVWRLTVTEAFPWGTIPERFRILTLHHFPPEADAIVMQCKVVDGEFTLCVGSPVAVFGDSDVITAPTILRPGGWRDVVFDLNHGLVRNYRRAGFSRHAQSISYTRWIQEPPALCMMPSRGTLLVRDIRLVGRGEGKPFPEISEAETIVITNAPVNENNTFTFFVADGKNHTNDFHASWKAGGQPRMKTPRLQIVPAPGGGNALAVATHWVEEIRWAGVKTPCATNANAVRLTMRLATALSNSVAGRTDVDNAVDIALLAAPAGQPFPFEKLAPKPDATDPGVRGYDYMYAHDQLHGAQWASAFYTTRRFVKQGEWATLTIPFADFTCSGATGALLDDLRLRRAPRAGTIRAVMALMPFPRRGPAVESTLEIGGIALVRVPEEKARASFFRPAPGTLAPVPGLSGYGGYLQHTESETP